MALMFQRLARNYIKNGYFPTDAITIERVLNALIAKESGGDGVINILDNCCGEGTALAECQHYLKQSTDTKIKSYGIEYNRERAWHSKSLLDVCIHGDINDCVVGIRQFGLVWLNPPYGDMVTDSDVLMRDEGGRKRLEKEFYRKTVVTLQYDGVMVLIIPNTSLDREMATWISKHFYNVKVFRAADDTFKQVVIIGKKRKSAKSDKDTREMLLAIASKEIVPEVIPEEWIDEQYVIPLFEKKKKFKFYHVKLDIDQLSNELDKKNLLWDRFDMLFNKPIADYPKPLRKLLKWHLALTPAAGLVTGAVQSKDGRIFVIKGDTYKDKVNRIETSINDDGSVYETKISTDKFVPIIKAIDFTNGSNTFGEIFTIK